MISRFSVEAVKTGYNANRERLVDEFYDNCSDVGTERK